LRHWSLGFAASYKRNKAAAIQVSTFRLTRVTRIFQKSVFTETTPAARAGCRAGFFVARTQAAAAHASSGAMQTAGCRNERPLFRDCSLQ
jgi:hypothetical protein